MTLITFSTSDPLLSRGFYEFLKLQALWVGGKFKYFKYDTKNTALTRLYVQKWAAADKGSQGPMIAQSYPKGRPAPFLVDINVGKAVYKGALNVFATTDSLLGVNLFNGQGLKPNTYPNIKSLDLLVSQNDPSLLGKGKGAAGLYIVGVNAIALGEKTSLGVVNRGEEPGTNMWSIVLLLVWPDGTNKPRVSLYSGGDTEYTMELKVANFLTDTTSNSTIPVKVVKAGHHGSLIGTAVEFITKVKPDHYLVSAGMEHGHPGTCSKPSIVTMQADSFSPGNHHVYGRMVSRESDYKSQTDA